MHSLEKNQKKEKNLDELLVSINNSHISSIKSVVSNILKVINDPRSTAKDLKEIIEIDPPLTGKILKVANSAYYSPREKISDIKSAIIWIGFDALKELALSQKVCEIFEKGETIAGYSRTALWKHCVCVAMLGKMIFRKELGERGDNAYAAGLLHDIGIIAEDQFLQNDFKQILHNKTNRGGELYQIEYEILGYDHTEIGKTIAEAWEFPQDLVIAIGYHHNPLSALPEFKKIVSTLYIANYLCHERGFGYCGSFLIDNNALKECLTILGVRLYALDLIMYDLEEKLRKMIDMGLF
ncbi:MAG: HDOD domain-containing protein [bacterium]